MLSFFQPLFDLGGIKKKRETQNDSQKCQNFIKKAQAQVETLYTSSYSISSNKQFISQSPFASVSLHMLNYLEKYPTFYLTIYISIIECEPPSKILS